MASDPWLEASFDAERIAFVTRRYEALRGLTNAGMGAALVAAAVTMHFLHASTAYPLSSSMAVMFIINVPSTAALEFEFRYRATFGRTEAPFEFATLVSWTGIFVMLGVLMDAIIMDRAPMRWASAAGIGLALSSGVVLLMDWRWRPHFAVPFCAGVAAVAMTAGATPAQHFPLWESDPLRAPVLLLANAFLGLGLVTSGMLDHRLLVSTLTPSHGASGATADMRARSATARTGFAAVVTACGLLTLCFPARQMALVLPFALIIAGVGHVIWKHFGRRPLARPDFWLDAEPFGLHPDTTIIFVLLAAAAVIDTAFISPAPVASTVVFALGSLWVCLRDWPFRRYYLSGAVVPLVLLPLAIRLEPARAFTLMLVACAAALTIESHFDGRSGEPQTLSRESDDADTI